MSHNVTLALKLLDLQSLVSAGQQLGLVFHANQSHFKSYTTGQCTHAFSIPNNANAFEMGVVAQKDGSFTLAFDPWNNGNGLVDVIGKDAVTFLDQYNIERHKKAAMEQGYTQFEEGYLPDGSRYVDVIVSY